MEEGGKEEEKEEEEWEEERNLDLVQTKRQGTLKIH